MINYYFPTAILSEYHPIMANNMLPVAKKYLADPSITTKKWGYKTSFSYPASNGLADMEDIKPFNEFILKTGKKYLTDLGYNCSRIELNPFIFVSEMFDGNYHEEHTHPESLLSGILYLQTPPGSSPIIFTDPRPFRNFIWMPKTGESLTNAEEVPVEPKKGLFLMWESWLPHLVPQTSNKEEGRITLVFNISRK